MTELSSPLQGTDERELSAPASVLLEHPLHAKIRAVTEYWLAISPAGRLPGRQHFEPLDIPSLLPNVWLVDVERMPDIRLRYRLIGTSVARAFDHDPTGEYLEYTHPAARDQGHRMYLREVVQSRQPAWRVGRPTLWHLQEHLRLERIYLPLANDGETVDMVLALTVFLDSFGLEF